MSRHLMVSVVQGLAERVECFLSEEAAAVASGDFEYAALCADGAEWLALSAFAFARGCVPCAVGGAA